MFRTNDLPRRGPLGSVPLDRGNPGDRAGHAGACQPDTPCLFLSLSSMQATPGRRYGKGFCQVRGMACRYVRWIGHKARLGDNG